MSDLLLCRRKFLIMGASAVGAALFPFSALARMPLAGKMGGERVLNLYNTNTGEFFRGPYWAAGGYIPEALKKIDFLLRDHRTNEKKNILPELLDLIYGLQVKLDYKRAMDVISGFRSPATNRLLRKKSKKVAPRSLHMQGAAIDLRFKGVPLASAHKAACSFRAGGVGYYPKSRFLHIDIRQRSVHWRG